MKKLWTAFCVVFLSVSLCACGGSEKQVVGADYADQLKEMQAGNYTVSYATAEDFENALNNDDDTLGKVVSFSVKDVKPDSALGYDLWAGEHLNFVGEDAKEAKKGTIMTVAVNSVQEKMGSWVIGYDVLNIDSSQEAAQTDNQTANADSASDGQAASNETSADSAKENTDASGEKTETEQTDSSLMDGLLSLGYSSDQANKIAEILTNVGIPEVDDMWNINKNGTLQANACSYKDHQINFTTDNGECFYVQITGWKEEIAQYGWYRSAWSGKLKYGYNTQTKINTVDLYATDENNPGYMAVYNAESDSVHPYGE